MKINKEKKKTKGETWDKSEYLPRYSIRTKLACITIMVITSIVLLCWVVNKTFLPAFYERSKIKLLGDTYEYIDAKFSDYDGSGSLDEDVASEIERICSVSNVKVYVYDYYSNIVDLENKTGIDYVYPENVSKEDRNSSYLKLVKYLPEDVKAVILKNMNRPKDDYDFSEYGMANETIERIESLDDYSIYKVYDSRINSYDIELNGTLDSGLYVYVSSNFDSIQESAKIANRFMAYIGIGATIIGFFVMLYISRSFSQPILDLASIARRMSQLDFDAHYDVSTEDEIGQLGSDMNFLSDTLKETIGELKSANNELQNDIENKIQIDDMRKEFLSNVSHELKTPIALIQGYAEGLKENINDDPESRDFYLDVIVDEANKMNNMVKKLLDLNHIEFGDSPISIERFDIVELINAVLSATDILVRQKEAKVIFEQKSPVYVWADEYMTEEVITNYISNALNHISGDKRIEINIEKMEGKVRISVFNTGENIPEDELDKVWIKFYKVDKARTREYGGSGVGLSIVKAIMNAHNRECGVVNKEDGVQFWFELDTTSIENNDK